MLPLTTNCLASAVTVGDGETFKIYAEKKENQHVIGYKIIEQRYRSYRGYYTASTTVSTTDTSYEYTVTETIGGAGTITVEPLYKSGCLNDHANTELKGKVEATCGRGGYTGDTVCKDCGYVVKKGEDTLPGPRGELLGHGARLDSLGHKWDGGTVVSEPTAENAGRLLFTCETCGATRTELVDKLPPSLNDAELKLSTASFTYTGSKIDASKYVVTVIYKGKTLSASTDYTVSCSNNTNVGTAKVTVTGKGDYVGSATASFKITAKNMSACTSANVKYAYANYTNYIKTLTGLTSNKTYYVRIRTYVTVNGSNIYGTWSAAKSIKVK